MKGVNLLGAMEQLGASAGSRTFAAAMGRLLIEMLAFDLLIIAECIIDSAETTIVSINNLGDHGFGPYEAIQSLLTSRYQECLPRNPIVRQVIESAEMQVILGEMNSGHCRPSNEYCAHWPARLRQCVLVSGRYDRRYVVALFRPTTAPSFSPEEQSYLRKLSGVLLAMVESHAARRDGAENRSPWQTSSDGVERSTASALRRSFTDRVRKAGAMLSSRETEVCVALLQGRTVAEVANHLGVGLRSVETYIKRASVKLSISGRHGLVRWMAGESRT